ncbi:MAG: glycosyl transferase family 1 [Candidatus Zixiibacteriota bacterium]|nr:MAG: glycosyl transferase family 1 [candidate division Zixibacteria bacterium]
MEAMPDREYNRRKITLKRSNRESTAVGGKVVAFCGTRGLPANYGGFETAVDEITRRFVDAGIPCDVVCRSSDDEHILPDVHNGRCLVYVKGSRNRKLDTFMSAIRTGVYLWRNRWHYRHVFWFNNANLPGILMTALMRLPMSVNTDGLEWRRAKWSWPFKLYYILSSFLICRVCKSLISDSKGIQKYYRQRFFKKTSMVPYGIPNSIKVTPKRQTEILSEYNLEKDKYFLQITRIEPDNYPLEVAQAFTQTKLASRGLKMVIIGYKEHTAYATELKALDGKAGVMIRPAVYDPEIVQTLRQSCFCYVHGNSVGGTNPALLEAMATCPRLLAIDCEFSREVLADTGMLFDRMNIEADLLRASNSHAEPGKLYRNVGNRYQWDAVAESYIRLAEGMPAGYRPAVVRNRAIKTTSETEVLIETDTVDNRNQK